MPDTRRLQQTLFDLQRRFGEQAVTTLAAHDPARDRLAFGYPALDALLDSGLARGTSSALMGRPSCGATTLALHLLAAAQGRAEAGVYLDLTGTFDPDYAAWCGVALDRLLLAQPQDVLQMLDIGRDLVRTGVPTLVVFDLLAAPLSLARSALPIPLRRLHDALTGSRTTLLFLLRQPLDALDSYTHTCLLLQRLDWLYPEGEVVGYQVRATVLKDKPHAPGQTALVPIAIAPVGEGSEP